MKILNFLFAFSLNFAIIYSYSFQFSSNSEDIEKGTISVLDGFQMENVLSNEKFNKKIKCQSKSQFVCRTVLKTKF